MKNANAPIKTSLLIFAIQELFLFYPKYLYIPVILLIITICFLTIKKFFETKAIPEDFYTKKNKINYLIHAIIPAVTSLAALGYILFFPEKFFSHLILAISAFLNFKYFKKINSYLQDHSDAGYNSFKKISIFINFIAYFFLFSTIYGLGSSLGMRFSIVIILAILFNIIFLIDFFSINHIINKIKPISLIAYFLIPIELSLIIYYLPINFQVSALILATCYYVLTGLLRNFSEQTISKPKVVRYIVFGFISIILLIATAKF